MEVRELSGLLVLGLLTLTRAGSCIGDPSKNIGDSWLCDDQCNTCSCNADGSIHATGLCCGDDCGPGEPEAPVMEEAVVKAALFVVMLWCRAVIEPQSMLARCPFVLIVVLSCLQFLWLSHHLLLHVPQGGRKECQPVGCRDGGRGGLRA